MGNKLEVRFHSPPQLPPDANQLRKFLHEIQQKPGKKSHLLRKATYQVSRAHRWVGGMDRLARGLPWQVDDVPKEIVPRIQAAYKDVDWQDAPTVFINDFSLEQQLQRVGSKRRRIPVSLNDEGGQNKRPFWERTLREGLDLDIDYSMFSGGLSLKNILDKLQKTAYTERTAKDQTYLLSVIGALGKSLYNPLTNSIFLYDDLPLAFKLIEKARIYDRATLPAVMAVANGGEIPSALNSNAISLPGMITAFIASRRALLRLPKEERREAARVLEWDFIYETLGIKMITLPVFVAGAWLHKKARESNIRPFKLKRSIFFLPKGSIPDAAPKASQISSAA